MRIEFIEVSNFRRLLAAHVDIAPKETLLVGANNSGKTSAMVALRLFLKEKDSGRFSTKDITASNWAKIENFAKTWSTDEDPESLDPERFNQLLPAIDVWISVADNELHHVAHLIPSLDWGGGQLGVRIRLEAKSFDDLRKGFVQARSNAEEQSRNYNAGDETLSEGFSLWPKSFQRNFTIVVDFFVEFPVPLFFRGSEKELFLAVFTFRFWGAVSLFSVGCISQVGVP